MIAGERGRRPPLALLPDGLLGPIVDAALDRLRTVPEAEVPVGLRSVLGFDRRARQASTLRRQVARALDADPALAAATAEFIATLEPIAAAAATHRADAPLAAVLAAAGRGDLEQLVAALWATAPSGAELALGAALAIEQLDRVAAELERDRDDWQRRARTAEEAARRADTALAGERARSAGLGEELRTERGGRRQREESAIAQEGAAGRRAEAAEAAAAEERSRAEAADRRARAEADRSRKLGEELGAARAELRDLATRGRDAVDASVVREIALGSAELARRASHLARELDTLAGGALRAPSAPEMADRRRTRPLVPGGLVADTVEGLAGTLASGEVLLVVDGYNVAFVGWPEASAADKREHVVRALIDLQHRHRCEIVCVFDGAANEPVLPPLRREGLHVVFSAAEEEADEVVVRTVERTPPSRGVLVVSSDRWVREHCEAAGALVVSSTTLVDLARTRPR